MRFKFLINNKLIEIKMFYCSSPLDDKIISLLRSLILLPSVVSSPLSFLLPSFSLLFFLFSVIFHFIPMHKNKTSNVYYLFVAAFAALCLHFQRGEVS